MNAPDPAPAAANRLQKLLALVEQDPSDAFCLYGVALEKAKMAEHESAVEWFDRALAADPDSAYAFFHKARSLVELGRRDQAVLTLQSGLAAATRSRDSHGHAEIEGFLDELGADS
jgi:tetratricopeptide (TPR) repeat protein